MNILKDNSNYRIQGRYVIQDDVLYLAYSASYIEFRFCGRKVTADLISDRIPEGEEFKAWAAVFINGAETPSGRFFLEQGCHTYVLFESDEEQEIELRLMKYSEAAFASFGVKSIDVEGSGVFAVPETKKPLIEFVGDYITCGYGIEGIAEKDVFTTAQENPWEAYACRTARLLDMDFTLISWSGNGIISHWVPDTVNTPRNDEPLMPQLYPYSALTLEQRLGKETGTLWQPEKKPDLVVVNLGTNDCSYTRCISERNDVFEVEYRRFISGIREANPDAKLICMFGMMDQRLTDQIRCAVEMLAAEGDEKLFFFHVPLQDPADGMGTDFHPSPVTHQKDAKLLAEFIKEIL